MNEKLLGENLRKIRKLYERKQSDIASCIGLSIRQYRKMENDEIVIKDKYLIKLAKCYDISIETIRDFNVQQFLGYYSSPESSKHNHIPILPPLGENESNYRIKEMREMYTQLIRTKDNIISSQQEFIAFLTNKDVPNKMHNS